MFWRKPILNLRGMLGKSTVFYTAQQVADELAANGKYGKRGADYKRWACKATNEQLKSNNGAI